MQESSLYDAVQEIDYLDKVVLETLRLHSPCSWKVCYIELTTISYTDCSITTEGVRV